MTDPKTLIIIAGAALVIGGAAWKWLPVVWTWLTPAPKKAKTPDIHEAVDAYHILCARVDKPTQKILHEQVWPALNGRL